MSESNMFDDTEEMDTGAGGAEATGETDYGPQISSMAAQYDIPEAKTAFALLASSSKQARQALADARAKILARKYNSAIPLLAASAALGAPTRAGSTAESFANMSGALIKPLEEKDQFERQQAQDILGIDTNMAGLDERLAQSQLSLATLKAKLAAQAANAPLEKVMEGKDAIYRTRREAHGKKAYVPAGSSTNVTIKQEGAEAQTVGKIFGEQYGKILQSGIDASGKINRYDRLASLLEGVHTGKLTPTLTQVAAFGDAFGIKLDPKLGPKQAIEALSKELALEARNPSGGAGMPGALSDADREFLVTMTPGLSKTPEGNRLIIETGRKLAQRDREVAKIAREYRSKHGHMDEGFYEELQNFAEAHPLFGDAPAQDAADEEPVADPAAVISPNDAVAVEPDTTSFYDVPKRQ